LLLFGCFRYISGLLLVFSFSIFGFILLLFSAWALALFYDLALFSGLLHFDLTCLIFDFVILISFLFTVTFHFDFIFIYRVGWSCRRASMSGESCQRRWAAAGDHMTAVGFCQVWVSGASPCEDATPQPS
jgi:hypothetical protein